MRIIYSWKWRLLATFGLSFSLVALIIAISAHSQRLSAIDLQSEWTEEQVAMCEARQNLPIDSCLSIDNMYDRFFCQNPDMFSCQHKQPKPPPEYASEDIKPLVYLFFGSSAVLFGLLSSTSMYIKEKRIGWRRLSILVASMGAILVVTISLLIASKIDSEALTIAILLGIGAFPLIILTILGGRMISLWIRDGFLQDGMSYAAQAGSIGASAVMISERQSDSVSPAAKSDGSTGKMFKLSLVKNIKIIAIGTAFLFLAILIGSFVTFTLAITSYDKNPNLSIGLVTWSAWSLFCGLYFKSKHLLRASVILFVSALLTLLATP